MTGRQVHDVEGAGRVGPATRDWLRQAWQPLLRRFTRRQRRPEAHRQLQMVWPLQRYGAMLTWSLSAGYTLRSYQPGDDEGYVRVMRRAGFADWGPQVARRSRQQCLADGLFFVVHDATGLIVATAAAQRRLLEHHPFLGEMGWVAADPAHRGRGLGYAVCAAATQRLLNSRIPGLFLLTDDHRLPAIRVYLKLGWVPYLQAPEMEGRWRAVCGALGCRFEDSGFLTTSSYDPGVVAR